MDTEPYQTQKLAFMQFPKFLLDTELSWNARIVYLLVYERVRQAKSGFWKDGKPYCYYSNEELEKDTGWSEKTVKNAISELKKSGLLERERTAAKDGKAITFLSVPVAKGKNYPNQSEVGVKITPTYGVKITPTYGAKITPTLSLYNKEITLLKTPPTKNGEPVGSEEEQEAAARLIAHFEKRNGRAVKATKKLRKTIIEDLQEYTPEEIEAVIDYRWQEMIDNPVEHKRFFTPSIVFGPSGIEKALERISADIKESDGLPEWYQDKPEETASDEEIEKALAMFNAP